MNMKSRIKLPLVIYTGNLNIFLTPSVIDTECMCVYVSISLWRKHQGELMRRSTTLCHSATTPERGKRVRSPRPSQCSPLLLSQSFPLISTGRIARLFSLSLSLSHSSLVLWVDVLRVYYLLLLLFLLWQCSHPQYPPRVCCYVCNILVFVYVSVQPKPYLRESIEFGICFVNWIYFFQLSISFLKSSWPCHCIARSRVFVVSVLSLPASNHECRIVLFWFVELYVLCFLSSAHMLNISFSWAYTSSQQHVYTLSMTVKS